MLPNILHRKAIWIGHSLRRNCLLHDTIERQMMEVKGIGRRRTQLLDDLKNRRYWDIKEESEDRKMWKQKIISEFQIFNFFTNLTGRLTAEI